MSKRLFLVAVLVALLPVAACKKSDSNSQGIRAAVQKHLAERGTLNLAAMDTQVKQFSVEGDHATAQVEIRAKQGGPAMEMTYKLQKQGATWLVTSGRPSGGEMSHPSTEVGMPPSAVPGGAHPSTPELPPSHPPTKRP